MIKGYINLLEKSPCNGATVHLVKQFSTVLALKLRLDTDISEDYEEKVKKLIRRIYLNCEDPK